MNPITIVSIVFILVALCFIVIPAIKKYHDTQQPGYQKFVPKPGSDEPESTEDGLIRFGVIVGFFGVFLGVVGLSIK